jgi:cobalamin 5'-phosphate synthase/cobalamin synthase
MAAAWALNSIKSFLQSGAAAFQFLTRLPVPVTVPFDERTLKASVVWYPAVGLVVGALLSAAGAIGSMLLPPLAASAIVVAVWLALTGGLHLDGLMDTADGLLSHRSRERMLEIMKDSRVGAMGVIAGCLQLLLKFALLTGWTGEVRLAPWLLLPAVPAFSRAFLAAAIAGWPYARAEGAGLGGLYRGVTRRHASGAAALAALLALPLAIAAYGPARLLEAAVAAALLAAVAYAAGLLLARRIARKLGGLTGDTYGALNELLETVLLLVMSMAIHLQYL